VERITLEVDCARREYLLFSPFQSGLPLVLFLHGTGATAEWADRETGWSQLAASAGFNLAVPEALRPHPDAPPRFLSNPQRWNDGSPTAGNHPVRPDDVAFLARVIDDVQAKIGIDAARVYLTGFSNGAAMAFRAASALSSRIAAVAPVAGYCWATSTEAARPVPTFYLIGGVDPLVPLRGGEVRSPWQHRYLHRPPVAESLERWARWLRCNTTPKTLSDRDGVRLEEYPGAVPLRVMTIEGLGHHWPDGRGDFNERIAGPPSNRVNATELIWEFFQQHSL